MYKMKKFSTKKLLSYVDTRSEAVSRQKMWKRKGISSCIHREYGGYAVRKDSQCSVQKPIKRKIKKPTTFTFQGIKI